MSIYNKQYLEEYAYEASIPLGRSILKSRWDTVKTFCDSGTLIDYGCGTGVFVDEAPSEFVATGWDVNPFSKYSGMRPTGKFDILTMWDVIEHLPAPLSPVTDFNPTFVFISTPNADNVDFNEFSGWKHFKPLEHIHYYSLKTLTMSFASIGYELIHSDFKEGWLRDPQNERAILTAAYKRCR